MSREGVGTIDSELIIRYSEPIAIVFYEWHLSKGVGKLPGLVIRIQNSQGKGSPLP